MFGTLQTGAPAEDTGAGTMRLQGVSELGNYRCPVGQGPPSAPPNDEYMAALQEQLGRSKREARERLARIEEEYPKSEYARQMNILEAVPPPNAEKVVTASRRLGWWDEEKSVRPERGTVDTWPVQAEDVGDKRMDSYMKEMMEAQVANRAAGTSTRKNDEQLGNEWDGGGSRSGKVHIPFNRYAGKLEREDDKLKPQKIGATVKYMSASAWRESSPFFKCRSVTACVTTSGSGGYTRRAQPVDRPLDSRKVLVEPDHEAGVRDCVTTKGAARQASHQHRRDDSSAAMCLVPRKTFLGETAFRDGRRAFRDDGGMSDLEHRQATKGRVVAGETGHAQGDITLSGPSDRTELGSEGRANVTSASASGATVQPSFSLVPDESRELVPNSNHSGYHPAEKRALSVSLASGREIANDRAAAGAKGVTARAPVRGSTALKRDEADRGAREPRVAFRAPVAAEPRPAEVSEATRRQAPMEVLSSVKTGKMGTAALSAASTISVRDREIVTDRTPLSVRIGSGSKTAPASAAPELRHSRGKDEADRNLQINLRPATLRANMDNKPAMSARQMLAQKKGVIVIN